MKISKIANYPKITFKSKISLTKPNLAPKIDMFCKSKESVNFMSNFLNLRDKFSDKLYDVSLKANTACWDFYIDSTDENMKKYQELQNKVSELFNDKNTYEEFLKIDKDTLSFHENKQLKNLLKSFEEELETGEDLKKLREKENEIAQKYNSYVPKIDGKEVSRTEISEILQKESNVDIRRKAVEARIIGADLIAEDMVEFANMRNEYAKTKGYATYFDYKLKEDYEVEIEDLNVLLEEVYAKSKDVIKKVITKEQKELAEFFQIDVKDLKSYHYGYLTGENPEKKVNDYLKNKEQVVELCKQTYKNMGYDVENLINEGKLTLDLFPRKGKNTHGFCFNLDAGLDARILGNLTNNTTSIDTLNHEMGHCVYTLGTSRELPFLDRENYPAMTEAIAMMMGDIQKRENILKEIVPSEVLDEFKKTFIKDEASFVTKALTIIDFEKKFYKNPNQDLKKLWHDMKVKYQYRSEDEELDNGWATIPHYLSHPAYYQNYFRASIIKAQIYNYLINKLGNITENTRTSEVLEKELFQYGICMEENELIEKMTGKKLSADDFVKNLVTG